MTSATLEGNPQCPPLVRQDGLPFSIIIPIALAIGVMSELGAPGSIVALPCGVLLAILTWQGRNQTHSLARTGIVVAAVVSLAAVILDPGLLALSLQLLLLMALALSSKEIELQHGADTVVLSALLNSFLRTPVALFHDLKVVQQMQRISRRNPGMFALTNLLLPVAAVGLFAALLTSANPMMQALLQVRFGSILSGWTLPAALMAFILLFSLRSALPFRKGLSWDEELPDTHWRSILFNPTSLTTTLVLLNVLFGITNIFDFRYVWLDGMLPPGLTHAEYVHRGSYTLIATTILAALLIVFGLRPGTATETSPALRKLVYLWIVQNVFLVASSAQRSLAYVEDYGMTMWRLSGLIWMVIVAAGLVLVAIRIIQRRGTRWLTNANLAVCLVVLLACGLIDMRWVVAEWNATMALDGTRRFPDLAYMQELGPSAIPALIRLKAAGLDVGLACEPNAPGKLVYTTPLPVITSPLRWQQNNWQTYTLRNARYLARLDAYSANCRIAGNR